MRGATDFAAMTDVAKELRAELAGAYTLARPEIVTEQVSVDGTRKWLLRLLARARGARARDRDRLHPRGRPRHAVHLEPGRLHADLHVLPYRHAAAGAQPDGRRRSSARSCWRATARRLAGRRRRRTTAACCPRRERKITNVVLMGMGEPLYNFDNVRDAMAIAADGDGLVALQAAHHAVDLAASCRRSRAGARRPAPCSRSRCTPCATSCATSWCRSTRNSRSRSCSPPAAPIRACPTPSASPSNM